MVMVHGDDKGLVLPLKVASIQVIVVPVPYEDADMQVIFDVCSATMETLSNAIMRGRKDIEEDSPSWKYSQWEMKGVPLRIEIGPKDMANNQGTKTNKLFEIFKSTFFSLNEHMFTPLHSVHCRSAIEMVEAELRDSSSTMNLSHPENASSDLFKPPLTDCLLK
ncbi:hypothetical protein IFM89_000133 [Coptis chinensis]|uniref:Anticodon-binding domain-containing protein n=1 Tax=Coptis chinensis TaxID=261450 RepID=A0A835HY15_9MAGN|nr:hypothetical protein IFM89_000133 [Coptis chinensis]